MGDAFTLLDLAVFLTALAGILLVGIVASRGKQTAEDYYLAGRRLPWWAIAGSIFGTNVTANHLVGMLGVGYSIGFAQSHFELGAVFGLLLLCYVFLPVYRKLGIYTLSEYLGQRYDHRSRVAYAIVMTLIMVVVQMVPGLYIGARSACYLLGDRALVEVRQPATVLRPAATKGRRHENVQITEDAPESVRTKLHVRQDYYAGFVVALALLAASYTILGGLKADVWTDLAQSALLLMAGIFISLLTFQKIGGWNAMMAMDQALDLADGTGKMHLYLPSNHPTLPWTGVFTGLIALHFYYWGTNQFIVQRTLGARTDAAAQMGILMAGFLKLLVPFFSIATGVAAYHLFENQFPNRVIDSDVAFSELVKFVVPLGTGAVGLIAAGLMAAVLSSINSLLNSSATIIAVDLYRPYVRPGAGDREMILVGRVSVLAFTILAAWIAIAVINPNSDQNFFLQIANYQNYFTPGIVIAFLMGMLWRRGTAAAAFVTILAAPLFSWLAVWVYNEHLGRIPDVVAWFGESLNFLHRVAIALMFCFSLYLGVSCLSRPDVDKARLRWTDLGGHSPDILRRFFVTAVIGSAALCLLGCGLVARPFEWFTPAVAGSLGAALTFLLFLPAITRSLRLKHAAAEKARLMTLILREDRLLAALLCASVVFLEFYFF